MRKIEYISTCDRCGATWHDEHFSNAVCGINVRLVNGIEVDLCSKCTAEYDQWMDEVQERWLEDGKSS